MSLQKVQTFFSGIQTAAAVFVAVLAGYAAWFTDLPEILEMQLRSELAALNDELTEARQTLRSTQSEQTDVQEELTLISSERDEILAQLEISRKLLNQLELEFSELAKENQALLFNQDELKSDLVTLNNLREQLAKEVSLAEQQQAKYAKSNAESALDTLSTLASFELQKYKHLVEIAANYQEHRNWLANARKVETIRREYVSLSDREKFNEDNPIVREYYDNLTAKSAPSFWLAFPSDPEIRKRNPNRAVYEEPFRIILSREQTANQKHGELIRWYFGKVLSSNAVSKTTKATFLEKLAQKSTSLELQEGANLIVSEFLQKLKTRCAQQEAGKEISIFFENEPSAAQIIELGATVQPQLQTFTKCVKDTFLSNGIVFPEYS